MASAIKSFRAGAPNIPTKVSRLTGSLEGNLLHLQPLIIGVSPLVTSTRLEGRAAVFDGHAQGQGATTQWSTATTTSISTSTSSTTTFTVLPNPEESIASLIYDSEVMPLKALDEILGPLIKDLGDAPDHVYLDDHRWPAVIHAAADALAVMEANEPRDGTRQPQ